MLRRAENNVTAKWFEIPLDVRAEHADEAVALLAAEGFAGCEVREGPQVTRLVAFAEAEDLAAAALRAESARAVVAGFLAEPSGGSSDSNARPGNRTTAGSNTDGSEVSELDPAVWTDNWRRHFTRRTFADRIEVVPPWESPSAPQPGLLSLVINPGMAFGTGLHETTASCLELLVELVRPGDRVADVGCGSGILALAALRLGADSASATDLDPLAVDAALENAERNGLLGRVQVAAADTSSETAGGAGAPFDLVVANILAETLVEMRPSLTSAVRDGGLLILSGIEATRLPAVLDAFVHPPWTLLRRVQKGEWASVAIERTIGHEIPSAGRRTLVAEQPPSQSDNRPRPTSGTAS
ncbi:MAG: 50S ribosomal protein L11 methyltransferase [Deltaproteobacteria bacterium]|nr:50S ribosomal protein L11 methyltransferase [Deltaproteobacteria bacterium]